MQGVELEELEAYVKVAGGVCAVGLTRTPLQGRLNVRGDVERGVGRGGEVGLEPLLCEFLRRRVRK